MYLSFLFIWDFSFRFSISDTFRLLAMVSPVVLDIPEKSVSDRIPVETSDTSPVAYD